MRVLFFLAWFIVSALVVWYMISQNPITQLAPASSNLSSDIEVIDEVSGSIYTGNSNTLDTNKPATEIKEKEAKGSQEILGESPENKEEKKGTSETKTPKNKASNNYPFLEVAYIEFNQNKVTLPKNLKFEKYLDSIANIIAVEDLKVDLVGHADKSLSNKRNNIQVGKQRAEFIRDALLKRNVPANKITVDSKGATEPRIDDITREANEKNRRVELFLKPNN